MKNFKRVISAVIAMAISASTLVAVSASKFTDVADTANCAEAVNVLSALKIVNGYEDGSFKPEGEITRAEAATMIVGALNMTDDAKAAAGTSKFTDVNANANWATGYVNVGVAQGFIAGMNDTTFAPQENVTYAQMCVMLTKITGYGDYAVSYGGYPTGYTTMAASAGINKGVALANDAKLTRGQVAQMIYNALTAPMLGVVAYKIDGNEYAKLDGKKGNDFKTLLSDKFDGYVFTGEVIATPNSEKTLEKGKVSLKGTKGDYVEDLNESMVTTFGVTGIYADIDVEDLLFKSGNAVIVKDADDEYHLVYFAENSNTDIKEYAAADYDSITSDGDYATVKFGSTKVKVPVSAVVYVNNANTGADVGSFTAKEWDAILSEAQGTVKAVKNTNGDIVKVMLDVYLLAQVNTVSYKNDKTTIAFSTLGTPCETIFGAKTRKIEITDDAVEEGDTEVIVTRNGEACELKDLQEDDIIAIYSTDVEDSTISDPKTIKILATNAKDEGSLTSKDVDDNAYTLNGTEYKVAEESVLESATVGSTIAVSLDPFGRIYGIDEEKTVDKYALVTYFSDSDDEVTLLTAEGNTKVYTVEDAASRALVSKLAQDSDIENRVVTYKVKARNNEAYAIASASGKLANASYNSATQKVGSVTLADSTYIIDATKPTVGTGTVKKISDLGTFSALTDDVDYEIYAWDKSSVTNAYGFVIVTEAGSTLGADSRFAVAKKNANSATVLDDETGYEIVVLYDGQEQTLQIADDAIVYQPGFASQNIEKKTNLQGRAFFFTKDSDGLVDAIYVIDDGFVATAEKEGWIKENTWVEALYNNDNNVDVQLVTGIVTAASAKKIQFGVPAENDGSVFSVLKDKLVIDTNISDDAKDSQGVYDFTIASDCVFYTYDADSTETKEYNKYYEDGSAKASNFKNFQFKGDTSYIWCKKASNAIDEDITTKLLSTDDFRDEMVRAFAMVVDGEVVAVYQEIGGYGIK